MTALCQSNLCAVDEYRLSLKSAQLENEYEKSLHQRNNIIGNENYRLLRVHALLLESDNDELKAQLQRASEQLGAAQASDWHVHAQLLDAENRYASSQDLLGAKTREIGKLKSEIASLNSNSLDSNKLLTEKLGLSRELSNVKVELEHLRSQSESYQTLLTEKHSLERQLSSLEVELDTTKRALERVRAKDDRQKEEETSAKTQAEELSKELARERRERQQIEEEARDQVEQWDTERSTLEGKLNAFRSELREARNKLDDMQSEIQEQRSKSQSRLSEENEAQRRHSRKRSIPQFDPDMTIGTPGDSNLNKKAKLSTALPGDKSNFSITPFLNRTSMSMESQLQESSSSDDSENAVNHRRSRKQDSENEAPLKQKTQKRPAAKPRKTAGSAAQETKASTSKIRIRGSSSTPALEKVPEENDDEMEPLEADTLDAEPSKADAQKPKLKRQKFLGASRERTLFDDEEELEEPQKNRRPNLGSSRGLGMRGGLSLGTSRNLLRGEALGEIGGRPEFSPLKKRRRPV